MADYGTILTDAARSDTVNASGLPLDMESRTKELEPDSYMMVALTRMFGEKVVAKQFKHSYRERRPIPNYSEASAATAAAASAISVKDYTRCQNDHLLYIPKSGEMYLIQDSSIDETVTVVRWPAGTGTVITAIAAGDPIIIGAEAHAEGEAVPTAYSNISVDVDDYCMQLDRSIKKTDVEAAIEHYDDREKSLALDRKIAWIETMRDINILFYVGQAGRDITSASGRRRHCLGGVFEKFTENDIDLSEGGGGLTEETLASILAEITFFSSSGKKKIGLFGTNGWKNISAWPKNALRTSPEATAWGVKAMNTIYTGFGNMDVAYDNVLEAKKGLADRAVILDQNHMRQMYVQGLPLKLYPGIQANDDIHNIQDCISGTVGIMTPLKELYAQISGIK